MKKLLVNAKVVNVFTDKAETKDVLLEDDRIIGVGSYYSDSDADEILDCGGGYICPAFIDSHMHIESTKLSPYEFCRAVLPHGTVGVIADPHEITNVCGIKGFDFMVQGSRGLPMDIRFMAPSCVPASPFDESYECVDSKAIDKMLDDESVLGLAEMMNYPGVLAGDPDVMEKINSAKKRGMRINGHAPLLSGKDLDAYIAAGVFDDHECSNFEEATEKISKGQTIFIRSGTSSNNLPDLVELFEEPYNRSCLLCTDDKDVADILNDGHIDSAIRLAIRCGVDPLIAIRMSTIQAAQFYGFAGIGAIAPGYTADFLVLDNINDISVRDVYYKGKLVVDQGKVLDFAKPKVDTKLIEATRGSMHVNEVNEDDFVFGITGKHKCRVMGCIKNQLLTENLEMEIDFDKNNGIDVDRGIVKVAVIERHHSTGHMALGLLSNLHLVRGAFASTVGHDSHNSICAGTNEADMAQAVNRVKEIGGGNVVVLDGEILAELPLPIAGLMSDKEAKEVAEGEKRVRKAVASLCDMNVNPLVLSAFLPLAVIPHLKITSMGYVDVDKFELVDFLVE